MHKKMMVSSDYTAAIAWLIWLKCLYNVSKGHLLFEFFCMMPVNLCGGYLVGSIFQPVHEFSALTVPL